MTSSMHSSRIARSVSLFFETPLPDERHQCELRPAGSGFIYKRDTNRIILLTAAHVVQDRGSVFWVKNSSEPQSFFRARLLAFDPASDVAVLTCSVSELSSSASASSFPVRNTPLTASDVVHTHGICQHGDQPVSLSGIVAQPEQTFSVAYPNQKYKLIQLAGLTTLPGMSGAPLVDSDGHLAGMVVKKFLEYGLALPVAPLLYVADELIKSGRCEAKNLGFTVKSRMHIYDEVKDGVLNGLLVTAVDQGSPADIAGLKVDDFVIAVNGRPSSGSACDIHDVLVLQDSRIDLTVERGSRVLRISLKLND